MYTYNHVNCRRWRYRCSHHLHSWARNGHVSQRSFRHVQSRSWKARLPIDVTWNLRHDQSQLQPLYSIPLKNWKPQRFLNMPLCSQKFTPLVHRILSWNPSQKNSSPSFSSGINMWKQDRRCVTWLDSQASRSVVHVSFGSIEALSRDQLLEVWHGLVNSGEPFLWVWRPDSVAEKESDFVGTLEKLERACIVGWAPQEEVLLHPAVGGFLSHCGRSSVIEGILGTCSYDLLATVRWPPYQHHERKGSFTSLASQWTSVIG